MFHLTIHEKEDYNELTNEFIYYKEEKLQLEHSLVSVSKWEQNWNVPFFSEEEKTIEQTIDYIRCMTITQNVKPSVYDRITYEHIKQINEYINKPMTATTFSDIEKKTNREIITNEIIYYWMFELGIPKECEKWHLNRLLTQIKVCSIKKAPPKKMSKAEAMRRQRDINRARRKKYNSKG